MKSGVAHMMASRKNEAAYSAAVLASTMGCVRGGRIKGAQLRGQAAARPGRFFRLIAAHAAHLVRSGTAFTLPHAMHIPAALRPARNRFPMAPRLMVHAAHIILPVLGGRFPQ